MSRSRPLKLTVSQNHRWSDGCRPTLLNMRVIAWLLVVGCHVEPTASAPPVGLPPDLDIPLNPCPVETCQTGAPVTAASQLVAMIEATPTWTPIGEYTTGCLPASKDIPITGPVAVRGADIAFPESSFPPVQFQLVDAPAGVTCVDPTYWFDFTTCKAIDVGDTTVRLRMVLLDIHPTPPNYTPLVQVLPACELPCSPDQFVCQATHTCWSTARDQCAYCLGGSNELCSCWNGHSLDADGTECTVWRSGDFTELGTCQGGVCNTEL